MIWCRYEERGVAFYGVVEDGWVVPVEGDPFTSHRQVEAEAKPVETVVLLPPTVPGTFFCAGMNYRGHAERAAAGGHSGVAAPLRPEVGYRANSALIGHGAPIVRPHDFTEPLEAEGELVAVIGRPLRHCTRDEAAAGVLGWTIGNDVSARSWQRSDRTLWRSKNTDTFKPMGPYLVTEADPMSALTTVSVDGTPRASFATGDMLFDPLDYICAIAQYITLSPGDVLWMGTDLTVEVLPGQRVEVSITGLGTLTNPVIEERVA
jgi:2-keto-4-pentenoate hydratase/2-oxohepta-3-ene-1,7-dioic acid hydratase in catechol pathway